MQKFSHFTVFNVENSEDYQMSHNMWFPTMWHFDKGRLGGACAASFEA